MAVRQAKRQDLSTYLGLLYESITEEAKLYPLGPVEPTALNMDSYSEQFIRYVTGFTDGWVGLWSQAPGGEAEGMLSVGDDGSNLATRWVKPAYVNGIYVRPERRRAQVSLELAEAARVALLDLGFTDCIGCVTVDNRASYEMLATLGANTYGVMLERSLKQ